MSTVIIYNMGGTEKLGMVPLRHAVKMLHRGVARVHSAKEGERFGPYELPTAVELVNYVFAKWVYGRSGKTPYSKTGVLKRDRHKCAYCGRSATTIDHVVPRCQDGASVWENVVAACLKCNSTKAGRTPAQAGMRLQWEPFVPSFHQVYG